MFNSPDPSTSDSQNQASRSILGALAVMLVCVVSYGVYVWWQRSQNDMSEVKTVTLSEPTHVPPAQTPGTSNVAPSGTPQSSDASLIHREETVSQTVTVTVLGSVYRPGQYHCPIGSRVQEAIGMAGGTLINADLTKIDMATPLKDGMRIEVPTKGDAGELSQHTSRTEIYTGNEVNSGSKVVNSQSSTPLTASRLDLNRATAEELEALPGVGPVLAGRIVEYRERNNGFKSVDELDAVNGIGMGKLEKLRPLVMVQ